MQFDDRVDAKRSGAGIRAGGPASTAVITALTAVFCLVIVLRNDWWNWSKVEPLLFGFLPVGLWWQACVSIMASILMALCVRFAWPGHLEDQK